MLLNFDTTKKKWQNVRFYYRKDTPGTSLEGTIGRAGVIIECPVISVGLFRTKALNQLFRGEVERFLRKSGAQCIKSCDIYVETDLSLCFSLSGRAIGTVIPSVELGAKGHNEGAVRGEMEREREGMEQKKKKEGDDRSTTQFFPSSLNLSTQRNEN